MPDFRVTIDLRDVALGDVKHMVDEIVEQHGENFDYARGDMSVHASHKQGDNYFTVDLEDDDNSDYL